MNFTGNNEAKVRMLCSDHWSLNLIFAAEINEYTG